MIDRFAGLLRGRAAHAVIACIALASLGMQTLAPLAGLMGEVHCGLVVSHAHLLLGGATSVDLVAHKAAEAGCGHVAAHQHDSARRPRARVLSILPRDANAQVLPLTGGPIGFVPVLPAISPRDVWVSRLDFALSPAASFADTPVEPPPEAV